MLVCHTSGIALLPTKYGDVSSLITLFLGKNVYYTVDGQTTDARTMALVLVIVKQG